MKRLVVGLAAMLIAASIIAPYSIGAIMHSNTIAAEGERTKEGRFGFLTVEIGCTSGERVHVRVTVTQDDANSVAEGWTRATCTGADRQQLPVRVRAKSMTRLAAG